MRKSSVENPLQEMIELDFNLVKMVHEHDELF